MQDYSSVVENERKNKWSKDKIKIRIRYRVDDGSFIKADFQVQTKESSNFHGRNYFASSKKRLALTFSITYDFSVHELP